MNCDHSDRSKMKKYHFHNKDVPEGFRTFSMDLYFCPECKNVVGATFVIPHPDAKPISAYSAEDWWAIRKGLKTVPRDTIVESAVEVIE